MSIPYYFPVNGAHMGGGLDLPGCDGIGRQHLWVNAWDGAAL